MPPIYDRSNPKNKERPNWPRREKREATIENEKLKRRV